MHGKAVVQGLHLVEQQLVQHDEVAKQEVVAVREFLEAGQHHAYVGVIEAAAMALAFRPDTIRELLMLAQMYRPIVEQVHQEQGEAQVA